MNAKKWNEEENFWQTYYQFNDRKLVIEYIRCENQCLLSSKTLNSLFISKLPGRCPNKF